MGQEALRERLHSGLEKVYGFREFRPNQLEIVEAILAKRDAFAVMPTGGGKSLCYQLPALMLKGTAVVVSPLIALMKDQVDNANALGIKAAFLNSTMSYEESQDVMRAYKESNLDLLYLAPERLSSYGFTDFLRQNERGGPSFFAIDEAHCISDWGHDFRPDYLFLSRLKELFPQTPITAFTATATHKVAESIELRLNLHDAYKVRASFNRHNLFYEIMPKKGWEHKCLDFIKARPNERGIIYRNSRKGVESTAKTLQAQGIKAAAYHAGMEAPDRSRTQDAFIRDDIDVMVATLAFGMGVDKPDVRFVIHADLPKNIESYYQETGRAGRDGEDAHCTLFYSPADSMRIRRFFDDIADEEEQMRSLQLLQAMEGFASVATCRRKSLLNYFGESFEAPCGACDFCTGDFERVDVTRNAQMVLSAIMRTNEIFGAGYITDIVSGAKTQNIFQRGHDKLPTYGVGKERPKAYWRALIDALVAEGFLQMSLGQFPTLMFTDSGKELLFGRETFFMQEDNRMEAVTADPDEMKYDFGLFNSLREIRKNLADEKGLPPYAIFSDRSLKEMAAYLPANAEEMLSIHGVGQNKWQKFGQDFLAFMLEYYEENPQILTEKQPWPSKQLRAQSKNSVRPLINGTTVETWELYQDGLSVDEIASKRKLAASTVEAHLLKIFQTGKDFTLRDFLTEAQEKEARELLEKYDYLKPIVDASQEGLSYFQLRLVSFKIESKKA